MTNIPDFNAFVLATLLRKLIEDERAACAAIARGYELSASDNDLEMARSQTAMNIAEEIEARGKP